MANWTEGLNERLTGAAVVLAAVAVLFWVVPVRLGAEGYDIDALFSGLTDFGAESTRGRLPAFIVAAFSSIFLLQLRRR